MQRIVLPAALMLVTAIGLLAGESTQSARKKPAGSGTRADVSQVFGETDAKSKRPEKIVKSNREWRKQLSRKQFEVARQGGTERARTGRYWNHKVKGMYQCICCDLDLFSSSTKFKSGTGWPSFYAPVKKEHIAAKVDRKMFVPRTEILCARCDAHLGHVFNDGPRPTLLRFCINSASLSFESSSARKRRLEKQRAAEEKEFSAEQAQEESGEAAPAKAAAASK